MANEVELLEIDRFPRNVRVIGKRRLDVLAFAVEARHVNYAQFASGGIFDDLGPGFIGFTESDRVRVAWFTVAAQRLIRNLGHMRTTHHDFGARRTYSVGHTVGA